MKRRTESPTHKIPFCHAYKEDLQGVIDVMTIDGERPTLVSDSFEFDDASELFHYLGEEGRHTIQISRRLPTVAFRSYGNASAVVESTGTDDAALAMFQRAVTVVRNCERKTPLRSQAWIAGLGGSLVTWGLLLASQHRGARLLTLSAALLIAGLVLLIVMFGPNKPQVSFYGVSRNSKRSFWQRKRDDIILNMGIAIVSAVLGVGGTRVAQAISK